MKKNFREVNDENDPDQEYISESDMEPAILQLNKDSSPGLEGLTSNVQKISKIGLCLCSLIRTDLSNDIS